MMMDGAQEEINYMRSILNGEVVPEENPLRMEMTSLEDILVFADFDYTLWYIHEETVLQPQLEEMGYTDIVWYKGETDSFGPLTRLCRAKNSAGEIVRFIYG